MAAVPVDSETFVGSHEKANNGYGQNGYQGPASDLPGQATRTDRDYSLPADPVVDPARAGRGEGGNWQTRAVSKEGYKPAFGHTAPGPNPFVSQREPAKIPDNNIRRPRVQAAPGSYQR